MSRDEPVSVVGRLDVAGSNRHDRRQRLNAGQRWTLASCQSVQSVYLQAGSRLGRHDPVPQHVLTAP
jgi:hypothetical protein